MSLPKKLAVFALLAAIPYAAQGTDLLAEPDIEINFEPNSNMEVVLQHTNKGFLGANENYDPQLERDVVALTKDDNQILNTNENGYSYAIEEKEAQEFVCDCQHNQNLADSEDYEADYDQIVVESEADEVEEKNIQSNIDIDAGNDDDKIEYAAIFVDNEEETHSQENKNEPEDKEIEECDCQDAQGHADNDQDDYEADYDQIVVEGEADEVKDDNKMDNFLGPDGDGDEDHACDCEDDKSDADDEDYDADLDEIFIESEVEAEKDEREEEERKKNLRAAFLAEKYDVVEKPIEDQEDLMIVVTYDQIMATMSQEEKEIEEKTGEPFYKRMYDLVVGKETQKELEAANILNRDSEVLERKPKFYYDSL